MPFSSDDDFDDDDDVLDGEVEPGEVFESEELSGAEVFAEAELPDEPEDAAESEAVFERVAVLAPEPLTEPEDVDIDATFDEPAVESSMTDTPEAAVVAAHKAPESSNEMERRGGAVSDGASAMTFAAKRIDDRTSHRESADLLTDDRLLDQGKLTAAEPEGTWRQLVYSLTRHRVNLGDSRAVRERKAVDAVISAPLPGGARFVPVLSRKGGVGKTTVTTLLGMALADARDDRVIAVDANPDRGTLADRLERSSGRTVRDLARTRSDVVGFNDISTIVARDETRLDVLSSDADPTVHEAFSDTDYNDVAELAAHYYSIVLTDTGTGIVHSVMSATLDRADRIVVVAGLSVDEARLASETLTWLETNGFEDQAREAVVVLNTARPGVPLIRADELEAHFRTRVRDVIRLPYDPLIARGTTISFRGLQPATRMAARALAASVVTGLRSGAPVA
nr:MinD/ParA family protein [Microbacterium endophyticum]